MTASLHVNDLREFIETAGKKGWIRASTATGIRSTVDRVFGVLDPEEQVDVARIDVDAVLHRFANKNPSISPQSLSVYGSRLRSAIKLFVKARTDPAGWRQPSTRPRAGTGEKKATSKPSRKPLKASRGEAPTEAAPRSAVDTPAVFDRGLSYPFPLRADVTITISNIPRDLRASEVDRIAQFLKALALGDSNQ